MPSLNTCGPGRGFQKHPNMTLSLHKTHWQAEVTRLNNEKALYQDTPVRAMVHGVFMRGAMHCVYRIKEHESYEHFKPWGFYAMLQKKIEKEFLT